MEKEKDKNNEAELLGTVMSYGTLEASLVLMSIHYIVDRLVVRGMNQAFGGRLTFIS